MIPKENLKRFKIFSSLSDEAIQEVSDHVTASKIKKGSYLFYRNDITTGLYFVLEGRFQIIIDNEANKEITVYTIGVGDLIGEMSLFSDGIRSATAVALEDSSLFTIKNESFIRLMEQHPAIGLNLSRSLVDRLLAANEMIERLGAMDGGERVADFIIALAAREGILKGDSYHLTRPTYHQISQRLGLSEKTIYRTMRAMAKEEKITIQGRNLTVDKILIESDQR